jgi:hypothetical protein
MVASGTNICSHCAAEIETGQRRVREKAYEPALVGREPRCRRYHAELFDGQELSWVSECPTTHSPWISNQASPDLLPRHQ